MRLPRRSLCVMRLAPLAPRPDKGPDVLLLMDGRRKFAAFVTLCAGVNLYGESIKLMRKIARKIISFIFFIYHFIFIS